MVLRWHRREQRLCVSLLLVSLSLLLAREASAVPVFARKYQTSCQTCHVAFPKLTPFGETFRRNNYHWPAGEEENTRKEAPVALGQDAYKRVFPRAVWPGELPAVVPFSAQLTSTLSTGATTTATSSSSMDGMAGMGEVSYTSIANAAKVSNRLNFTGLGSGLVLNLAGTAGDRFAAWARVSLNAETDATGKVTVKTDFERVFVAFTLLDRARAMLKVGRFEPGVLSVSSHRVLGSAPWILSTPVRNNGLLLEPAQQGLEASGVLARGRLAYAAGVVEGSGNIPNSAKDGYGRLACKLGGMRLDGEGEAKEADPWREKSLQLGVFSYRGQSLVGDPALAMQTDTFWRAGGDLNLIFRDANLLLAYARGENERPSLVDPSLSVSSWHAFSQLDYVVFPWLVPTVRYEHRDVGGTVGDRLSGGVYLLMRANIRAQVLGSWQRDDAPPPSTLTIPGQTTTTTTGPTTAWQVSAGMNLAY